MTEQTSTQTATVEASKAPYSPPQLTHYGSMDRLVHSSSGGLDDGSGYS